jgi:aryl-alcohol dehydrogenase
VGEPTQCLNYGEHNFPTRAGTSFSSTLGPVHAGFFGQSSFATIALASERNAVRVETALPPELLAPLGCGIQTGVGAITHVAQLRSTQTLVIIGMGAVGLAALFAALDAGARAIVAVDTNDSRLTAADQAGAMATIDASRPDWWADVRRIFPEGADVVVESSGAPVSLPAALQCVRSGGTVVVAGAPPFTHETPIRVADLVNRSITIKGTAEGGGKSRDRIPRLVRMVESGALPLALMLEVAQFSDIPAWLQRVSETTPIKPVFRMPQTAV